jgi:hypothetical protein
MFRSLIRKKLTICASSLLLLSGCAAPDARPACHAWTKDEKEQHYHDDLDLPYDSSLHGIIRDYIRLCGVL